jgi:hypothetical protein
MNNTTYSVMKEQRILGQKYKLDLGLRALMKVTVRKYVILEGMPLEPLMRVHLKRGMRSLVVLQIVLCSGITPLSGNRTPVTKFNARNISDRPKQKRTLTLHRRN